MLLITKAEPDDAECFDFFETSQSSRDLYIIFYYLSSRRKLIHLFLAPLLLLHIAASVQVLFSLSLHAKMFLNIPLLLAVIICNVITTEAYPTQVPLSALEAERVPGNNGNATFCTVPRSEQLFQIWFFDIAPEPLLT